MKAQELIEMCEHEIKRWATFGIGTVPRVTLWRKGRWGKRKKTRLDGKKGPLGVIVCEQDNGIVILFDAQEVLDYVKKRRAKRRIRSRRRCLFVMNATKLLG